MNDNSFEIIERVCMTAPSHQHYLLMQARNTKSGAIDLLPRGANPGTEMKAQKKGAC